MIAPFVRKPGGGLMSKCCCETTGTCQYIGQYEYDFPDNFPINETQQEHIHPYPMCLRTAVWCQREIDAQDGIDIEQTDYDYLIYRGARENDDVLCVPVAAPEDACGPYHLASNRPYYWSDDCDFSPTQGLDDNRLKFNEGMTLLSGNCVRVFRNSAGQITQRIADNDPWPDILAEITAFLDDGINTAFFTVETFRWSRRGKLVPTGFGPNICGDNSAWWYGPICKLKIEVKAWAHGGDLYCEESCE